MSQQFSPTPCYALALSYHCRRCSCKGRLVIVLLCNLSKNPTLIELEKSIEATNSKALSEIQKVLKSKLDNKSKLLFIEKLSDGAIKNASFVAFNFSHAAVV